MKRLIIDVQNSYDRVAEECAREFFHELEKKPFDRDLLEQFAAKVKGRGPVCDLGCGPGQIARYLHDRGVDIFGMDLPHQMVRQARRLNPDIEFRQGNMLALEVESSAWGGIVAFYSLIHLPRTLVGRALNELKRVLRQDGSLLLSFHKGRDIVRIKEWRGKEVSLDLTLFEPKEMEGYLAEAGYEIDDVRERAPYEGNEYPSRRVYMAAHKPH